MTDEAVVVLWRLFHAAKIYTLWAMVDSFICSMKKKYFHAYPVRMLVDFAHNFTRYRKDFAIFEHEQNA